jgi:small GTP-binding protein
VVVTGDSGVGKTNIISRFTSNEFNIENKATIGVEFGHAELTVKDTKVKVQIWDTGNDQRTFLNFTQRGKNGSEQSPEGNNTILLFVG